MREERKIRIAIVDKDKAYSEEMITILEEEQRFEIVGVFEDADNFLTDLVQSGPDWILLDMTASDREGIPALGSAIPERKRIRSAIAHRVLYLLRRKDPEKDTPVVDYHLTNREKEVLACVVNGLSHKMIGAELRISYDTVRSHIKKIYEKLQVASLTGVVAKAINQKLV